MYTQLDPMDGEVDGACSQGEEELLLPDDGQALTGEEVGGANRQIKEELSDGGQTLSGEGEEWRQCLSELE